jgi:hypothetical protein
MKIYILILIFLVFASCERLFIEDDPEDDPVTNFEILWNTIDKKYSFFIYKNIDWDSIYQVYRPMVYEGMARKQLFRVMSDMLFELRDGHVNLYAEFNISRNWDWYLQYPQNFNYSLLERNYLANDYEITGGSLINKEIDSVGYIYYSSFSRNIAPAHVDYIINKFADLKGIIIDVRNNGGGNTMNAETLSGRFADIKRISHYDRYKSGPGHTDFSDPVPIYIKPDGNFRFLKPVIVLTNRSSYSATNDFVQKMSVLPHVTIMGDTTGGGGGFPIEYELPIGWKFRFSSTVSVSPDGANIEFGIPPDVVVYMDKDDELKGKDTILEEALRRLK